MTMKIHHFIQYRQSQSNSGSCPYSLVRITHIKLITWNKNPGIFWKKWSRSNIHCKQRLLPLGWTGTGLFCFYKTVTPGRTRALSFAGAETPRPLASGFLLLFVVFTFWGHALPGTRTWRWLRAGLVRSRPPLSWGFLPWARRVAGTVVTSAPEEGVGVFPCYFIPVPHEQAADSNKPRAFVTPWSKLKWVGGLQVGMGGQGLMPPPRPLKPGLCQGLLSSKVLVWARPEAVFPLKYRSH